MTDRRETGERREDAFRLERTRVSWSVVAWILGVVVTALMTYNATANTVRAESQRTAERVSILEAKQNISDQRLMRIESKLDEVLQRVR